MALRNNVNAIKLELWKEVRPLDYFLVDIIIEKTIGWCETEASISMKEFTERSGKRSDEIYSSLKRLEETGIIRRKKKDIWIYFSLNEDYFGSLLIKKHQDALNLRKKMSLIVDNSKELDGNSVQVTRNFRLSYTEIPSKNPAKVREIIDNLVSKDTY